MVSRTKRLVQIVIGIVTSAFFGSNEYGTSMAMESNGKLLMAGHSNNDFAVCRYNLAAAATIVISTLTASNHSVYLKE